MRKLSLSLVVVVFAFFVFATVLPQYAPAQTNRQRIGIIGGGGAGMATAWLLEQDADVTVLEKESKLGGHADTVYLDLDGHRVPVEAGFEFFNRPLYPHFIKLLNTLDVQLNPYRITYTFFRTDRDQAFALPPFYIGGGINPDMMDLHYLATMIQFKIFLDNGAQFLQRGPSNVLLQDYLNTLNLAGWFKEEFLYPFLASMWGVPLQDIRLFVAYPVVQWLVANSGGGLQAPEFLEVVNGLSSYIGKVASQLTRANVQLNAEAVRIRRTNGNYEVSTRDGRTFQFDQLVMATSAHQAARLLDGVPSADAVRLLLSKVEYFRTHIALHGDWRLMPREYSDWGVVNVRFDGQNSAITAHKYWKHPRLRIYKSWVTHEVASNKPLPSPLYALREYWHPKLTRGYIDMQRGLAPLQGVNNLWVVGMYTGGLDNHETAITSAIRVAQRLTPRSARLRLLSN